MILHDVFQLDFDFFSQKTISVTPVQESLSTDAGLLIFRQFDEQHQFTVGFAGQLEDDRRDPDHSLLEMVRSRVFGILRQNPPMPKITAARGQCPISVPPADHTSEGGIFPEK